MARRWCFLVVMLFATSCTNESTIGQEAPSTRNVPSPTVDSTTATPTSTTVAGGASDLGEIRVLRSRWRGDAPYDSIIMQLLEDVGYQVTDLRGTTESAIEASDGGGLRIALQGELFSSKALAANTDLSLGWWGVANEWTSWDWNGLLGDRFRYVGTPSRDMSIRGFVITKSWAEAESITTLGQLHDSPELRSATDLNGDGQGDIAGCEEDCPHALLYTLAYNNWDEFDFRYFDPSPGWWEDSWELFLERIENGEPAIAYLEAPSHLYAQAQVGTLTTFISLEDDEVRTTDENPMGWDTPPEIFVRSDDGTIGFDNLPVERCTQGPDGCQLGLPSFDLSALAPREWIDSNPTVDALLDVVDITREEYADLVYAQFGDTPPSWEDLDTWDADIQRSRTLAANWIDAHPERVAEWLAAVSR